MPVAGTATEARHWLLIEDPTPWGAAAVQDAAWYPQVADAVARWQAALPDLRVQLIRRALKTWDEPGRIRCYFVRAGTAPVVHQRSVPAYAALGALEGLALWRASGVDEDAPPLVLTCTNGRRDACCAKWGRPVAAAVQAAAPQHAWQTSHLGGHRFAPTVLALPYGAHYGWIAPAEAPALVAAHREGRLFDLSRYRGCVAEARPVQAARIALRRRTASVDYGAIETVRAAAEDDATWHIELRHRGRRYGSTVRATAGPAMRLSCTSEDAKPTTRYAVAWDDEAA